MKNPWLHRCAILLAVFALIVIGLGACFTSEIRTLPGAPTPSTVSMPSLEQAHRIAGYALAILTLGLAIWTSSLAGWLALAAVAVESLSAGSPIVHAFDAQVFFALLVAIVVLTAKSWQAGPMGVACRWNPLRPLGMAIPLLVFLQIGLGAAFRHNSMGVVWHILDALIVLAVVMVAGVCVLQQYPEHPSLRPAALTLTIVAGVQVLLGFSVYLILLMSSENNTGLIITGVLHLVNGALTLAASVVLAMQMQRNLIQLSGV
jgi:heme A synthase